MTWTCLLLAKYVVQIHMRLINPALDMAKVGSKHEGAFRTFAADLFEEILLHGRQDDDQPALFHVSNNTIVLTDMCKNAVLMHLKTTNVQLTTYPRTLAWFQLDEDSLRPSSPL